ncbi:hypothetical protein L1887_53957 [Cichorium endivia]|nr:hypothetical protein L1887_53957 [Cichorium endivia]
MRLPRALLVSHIRSFSQSTCIPRMAEAGPSTPRTRRTRPPPPTSLPDHFSRKGYLSVSDLVGPSWCEYAYQYNILSLSHLPPALRPETITTEAGQTLAAAADRVAAKEVTLQAGKAVHSVLEAQVAPVQVHVETHTKEDAWALRLLNLWCGIRSLLQLQPKPPAKGSTKGKEACVREIPVYGWIHDVFVMGVVDELSKRPLAATDDKPRFGRARTSGRRMCGAKPRRAMPTRTHAHRILQHGHACIAAHRGSEDDQHSARMQCMTYKRLLDGLCLGALPSASHREYDLDPSATPMDWPRTFRHLGLDGDRPLSASFVRDATPACESWGTDLALFVAQHDADMCTLHHIRLLLDSALREWVHDAQRGASQPKCPSIQGLELCYRSRRKRRASAEEHKDGIIGVVKFAHDAAAVDAFLADAVSMWKGQRALVGVDVQHTRRCWSCEWQNACEWRQSKSTPAPSPHTAQHDQDNKQEEDQDIDEFSEGEWWASLEGDLRDAAGNKLDW